ncbi:MAG: ABC transporter permease [Pseudomonadota bacterium]
MSAMAEPSRSITPVGAVRGTSSRLPLPLRFALRELRGGLKGFYVFIACIALGVAAIAGVGSVSRALIDGINQEGQTILGGDAAFILIHRELDPDEYAFLDGHGEVVTTASLRAMATVGDQRTLSEVKAVEDGYPLFGAVEIAGGGDLYDLISERDGVYGLVAERTLFDRLGVEIGDSIRFGNHDFEVRGILDSEPDRLAGGMGFGPRAMVSREGLDATGLIQPGSLVRWRYGVAMDDPSDAALRDLIADAKDQFPDAGWEIRSRANAAPGLTSQIERFTQFLSLVGFTALVVGGIGVANAVRAHLDRRRGVIATLKAVGADGGTVFWTYFLQILILALIAIVIGLAIGAAVPFLTQSAIQAIFPIEAAAGTAYPRELILALVYGVLLAAVFALWPLGRARDVPVNALFRDHVSARAGRPRLVYLVALAGAALALAGVVIGLAYDPLVSAIFVASAIAVFIILRAVAWLIMVIARRVPRPRGAALRLAVGNIHRPGAITPTVVLSLGLGLTLFVTIGLLDGNLSRELQRNIPDQAPSFFFLDIPRERSGEFSDLMTEIAPDGQVEKVPMLRGRIVAVEGVRADQIEATPDAAWVLRGDRGVTYQDTPPEGSTLVTGEWWPADYAGPPLVSFDDELATGLGLEIGETLTVNVLGRNLEVTVANTRTVAWENLSINFVMIFSPNTFASAPHMMLATVSLPDDSDAVERGIMRAVSTDFPEVATVRVKEALDAVNGIISQLAMAIRAASSVTLIAGILVLAGALAASHRHRVYDAVILKTLGATRGRLLWSYTIEFGILGLATAAFALLAGSVAAYLVLTYAMAASFVFLPGIAVFAVVSALTLTLALGLAGTWRILGEKPARHLRDL